MLEVKIKKELSGFKLTVDLTTDKEILSILGPSGSGKTMTLKCIAGLVRPDEGYIRLNDQILFDSHKGINLPARQRRVGFVFQNYALFPHLTVQENISYGISSSQRTGVKTQIAEMIDKMHINGLEDRYPGQLSSGQQQRVALARSLFQKPEILLLDEPFSALDTHRKEGLEYELLSLQRHYSGDMLFVTHDVGQGYKMGTRIAVFESGKIVQCDVKKTVLDEPANRTVARLMGVKNLIESEVIASDDSTMIIRFQGSENSLKVRRTGNYGLSEYRRIIAGIRPEHVEITAEPGENTVRGVVSRVVDGVNHASCFLQLEEVKGSIYIEVSLSKPDAALINEGQLLYLRLPPDRLIMMKSDSA